jgi:hypothetical protein
MPRGQNTASVTNLGMVRGDTREKGQDAMSGDQRTWPMQDGGGGREGSWDIPAECRDIEQDAHGKCGSASREPGGRSAPSSGTVDAHFAGDASSVEAMPEAAPADPEKSSARKISDATPAEQEFEEGPPRHRNPAIDTFKAIFAEARQIEPQISAAEAKLEQDVEPLVTKQILLAFRASKLVDEGRISARDVDSLLLEAGTKPHGNEKIKCSRLVRAIVLQNESKGTPQYKRKRQRATPYASGIDYGIQQGMTEEDFEKELRHPPTPGKRHGIERLAELGVKLRRGQADNLVSPALDLPYRVDGGLSRIPAGYRLMLVRSDGDTAMGALLTVPESMMRRVLAADAKVAVADRPGLKSRSTQQSSPNRT